MPRITISINAPDEAVDQDLLTLDVPLDLTLRDLKGMVEADMSFPPQYQHFYLNGHVLRDDNQTLDKAGIKDGEMLAMMVNRRSGQNQSQRQRQPVRRPVDRQAPLDAEHIEATRRRLAANPAEAANLIQIQPDYGPVLNDPQKFRELCEEKHRQETLWQRERENEIALYNEDPFNSEAQEKFMEIIRKENIEDNLQYAYENNPEVFGQVTLLCVNVKVNKYPIKAFVDSGATKTVMSPSCAKACGIHHLIDERFKGEARGIGTAKILGRVHNAKVQIGDAELDCPFTVMEGKDVDLLFGLDMLKRHQACINLMQNKLQFPHIEVPFLGESEIPKRWKTEMMDEPVGQGPDGTEAPTARPAGSSSAQPAGSSSAQPAEELHDQNGNVTPRQQASAGAAESAASSSSSNARHDQSRWSEKDVNQLISLGFSRQEALAALDATGGNVEYAAGRLFGR